METLNVIMCIIGKICFCNTPQLTLPSELASHPSSIHCISTECGPCLRVCQVISGHQGWVRCVDVEPGNEWFVTGAADRMIKVPYTHFSHVLITIWVLCRYVKVVL